MMSGWIDGQPDQPGTYWIIINSRAGYSRPELWDIERFSNEGRFIHGRLGRWEFINKSIIAKYLPWEENDADESETETAAGWIG